MAVGAAEKGVQQVYEWAFRPEQKRHEPWIECCRTQMHGALGELERLTQARPGEWMLGERMTQADVTASCVFTFLCDARAMGDHATHYPGLSALAARCDALPAFRSVNAAFDPPTRSR